MSQNTLNRPKLIALGAGKLADLLINFAQKDGVQEHSLWVELLETTNTTSVVQEIRKRIQSFRCSSPHFVRRQGPEVALELWGLVHLTEARVAPGHPDLAFELLWELPRLIPHIYTDIDDSHEKIDRALAGAMEAISRLASRLTLDSQTLAERVFEGLRDNEYGQFDGAIPALSDALGTNSASSLRCMIKSFLGSPLRSVDLKRYGFLGDLNKQSEMALEYRSRSMNIALQQLADLQGDVDAYTARYTTDELTGYKVAANVAERLLNSNRPTEALLIVERAQASDPNIGFRGRRLDGLQVSCLDALERHEEATALLWEQFLVTLNPEPLREHISRLPNSDRDAVKERAKSHAMADTRILEALSFFYFWPDFRSAAELIEERYFEIAYPPHHTFILLAEELKQDHPLAATLLLRVVILDILDNNRAEQYQLAAKLLVNCGSLEYQISEFKGHLNQSEYVAALRKTHHDKITFWKDTLLS